jgi:hypothetical protein
MAQTLAELVPNLKTHVSGLVDWSYLSHANGVLLECRRVLSNAYVFAYFMFDAESFLEVRCSGQYCKRLHVNSCCSSFRCMISRALKHEHNSSFVSDSGVQGYWALLLYAILP